MKHSILGFQQSKLLENGFKTDDALILRLIKDMFSSASMEFKDFDGTRCMWVNYTYFLSQIPIIGSKSNLMSKIKSYEEKGLIIRKLENRRNNKKGTFAFISPTVELDRLQDYDPIQNLDTPLSKNNIGVVQNLDNKDTSCLDNSIKNITTKQKGYDCIIDKFTKEQEIKETIIEFIKMRKAIKKPLTDHALDMILKDLSELSCIKAEKIEILDNSIKGCWQGVFALREEKKQQTTSSSKYKPFGNPMGD
jgi:hypothetical protein